MNHKMRDLTAGKERPKRKSFTIDVPEALYTWIQVISMRLHVTPSDILACSLFAAATPIAPTIFPDYIKSTSRARTSDIVREGVGENLDILQRYDIASCHLYSISTKEAQEHWERAAKLKRSFQMKDIKHDNTQT